MNQTQRGISRRKFVATTGVGISGAFAASALAGTTITLWNTSSDPFRNVFESFQKMFPLKAQDKSIVDTFCTEFRANMAKEGFAAESKLPTVETDWESDLGQTLFSEFVVSTNVFELSNGSEDSLKRIRAPFELHTAESSFC
jgi:hypothetical protein